MGIARGGVGLAEGSIILSNLEPFAQSTRNGAVRCSLPLSSHLFLLGHFSGVHSILLCLGSRRKKKGGDTEMGDCRPLRDI